MHGLSIQTLFLLLLAGGSFISSTTGALDDSDEDGSDEEGDDEGDEGDFEDFVASDSDDDWEERFKPMKMPKELVFEPLPLRFATDVDTRIKPDIPPNSREQYNPNNHPITRRRYFVYCNDRMKEESYNLNEDNIIRNPERSDESIIHEEVEEMLDNPPTDILEESIREYIDNKVRSCRLVFTVSYYSYYSYQIKERIQEDFGNDVFKVIL